MAARAATREERQARRSGPFLRNAVLCRVVSRAVQSPSTVTDHPPTAEPGPGGRAHGDRLESWKEIAAYLRRDVTTVQRWERREAMPVHRHVHDKAGSVHAFRSELDAWAKARTAGPISEERSRGAQPEHGPVPAPVPEGAASAPRRRRIWALAAAGTVLAAAFISWRISRDDRPANPLADARFIQLTTAGESEQAAALSQDGKFAAFLSSRDGRPDVWVTQVGSGQFHKITQDVDAELVNQSVRTLGFSPDGAMVTFWTRKPGGAKDPSISVWSAPVLGGPPRPYLENAAEFAWSSDGTRLVWHTPGPGDPMFVRDPGQGDRQIFSAAPGLHAHFPVWSRDGAFIYFVQGSLPDRMDLWRIPPAGGPPEQMTHHASRVSYPVFVDERTLLYLASGPEDGGPAVHSLDVEQREPRRVSFGLERYTSLAASGDGRRLVATVAGPRSSFWRFPIAAAPVDAAAGRRIPLTTGSGTSPRLGAGYLLYVSSKGESDSIWKLQGEVAGELWSAADTRIIDGPAIARDGRRVAFSARRHGEAFLYVVNADGTDARILTQSLALHGAPAWAPDGQSLTVAAVADGAPRLFSVPLDGRPPAPLVESHAGHAADPAWLADGEVVYSGPDVGTVFDLRAVSPAARTAASHHLTLSRGSKYRASSSGLAGPRSLVVLRGELDHRNLWLTDLESGAERQLTALPQGFNVVDFDVSPDGRELVLQRVEEHSTIVLIELPRR